MSVTNVILEISGDVTVTDITTLLNITPVNGTAYLGPITFMFNERRKEEKLLGVPSGEKPWTLKVDIDLNSWSWYLVRQILVLELCFILHAHFGGFYRARLDTGALFFEFGDRGLFFEPIMRDWLSSYPIPGYQPIHGSGIPVPPREPFFFED